MGIKECFNSGRWDLLLFFSLPWHHTFVHSTDQTVTELENACCVHFLTSYSFLFSSLYSGLHLHHLMKTALSQPPTTSMLSNPVATSQDSSLLIFNSMWKLTTSCFLKHSWLIYHSLLSFSGSSFHQVLKVFSAGSSQRSHLFPWFYNLQCNAQISQAKSHFPEWQTLI